MNNIPRGTKVTTLLNYLLEPRKGRFEALRALVSQADVHCGAVITDSRLDDDLSVATIEFANTPIWLQYLSDDPYGFPKKTPLGTIWEGVNRNVIDVDGRTAFIRAVMNGEDPLFVEMLAEFNDTDVNIQDKDGMTALHWACTMHNMSMVQLCLSISDLTTGIRDTNGHTAFDIAVRSDSESIPNEFYHSIFEMDEDSPQGALLRALTIASERNDDAATFPGIALFDPVETSNEPLVVALIDRGIELTIRNDNGDTALHVAAQKGNVAILKALNDAGCNINDRGNRGATPLHYAAITGNTEMVDAILASGADCTIQDNGGNLAFHLAEQNKHFGIAHLLKTHRTVVIPKNKHRATAAQQTEDTDDRIDIRLVEGEPDDDHKFGPEKPRRRVADGRSGLEYGPEVEDDQVLKALLQVALSAESNGVLALQDLAASVRPAKDYPSWKALHLAVRCGNLEMCKLLLTAGADVNSSDWFNDPVLYASVDTGEIAIVQFLLSSGANINAVGGETKTALHKAASCKFQQIIVGGSVDKSDITALDLGMEILRLLLAAGANVNAANYGGDTALHIAASAGLSEVVGLLLESGALIEAIDHNHSTALHNATAAGHTSVVSRLLLHGANTEARKRLGKNYRFVDDARKRTEKVWPKRASASGSTALHLAARRNCPEIVEILLANGAVFNSRSVDGTPREVAEGGNTEIIAMLDRAQRYHDAGTGLSSP